MPLSTSHEDYYGEAAGNGHCVALVRECCGLPHTSNWRQGIPVRGANLPPGTPIATFEDDGTYGNNTDGSSHAAILLAETDEGLLVADQWVGQAAHERVIRFKGGAGTANNDGDCFHVIELA